MPLLQNFPQELPPEESLLGNIAQGTRPLVKALMDLKTSKQLEKFSQDPLAQDVFRSTGSDIEKTTRILSERLRSGQVKPPQLTPSSLAQLVESVQQGQTGQELTDEQRQDIKNKAENPEALNAFQNIINEQFKTPAEKKFKQQKELVNLKKDASIEVAKVKKDLKIEAEENKKWQATTEDARKKAEEATQEIHTSQTLSELVNSPEANLPNPLLYNAINSVSPRVAESVFGSYTDAQKFKSYIKDYYKSLKSIFGQRPSVIALQTFSDALPKLKNTKEANNAILQSKILHSKFNQKLYRGILDIKDRYNRETGRPGFPPDMDSQLQKFFDEELNPFLETHNITLEKVKYLSAVANSKNVAYNSVDLNNAFDSAIQLSKETHLDKAILENINSGLKEIGNEYKNKTQLIKDVEKAEKDGDKFGIEVGILNGYRYVLTYNKDKQVFETIRKKIDE